MIENLEDNYFDKAFVLYVQSKAQKLKGINTFALQLINKPFGVPILAENIPIEPDQVILVRKMISHRLPGYYPYF